MNCQQNRRVGATLLLFLLGQPIVTGAAETEDFEVWSQTSATSDPDLTIEPPDQNYEQDNWYVRVGVIGGMAPEFPGSDDYEPGYAPRIKIVWRDRFFINDRVAGVNLVKNPFLSMGGFIRYAGGRSESNPGLDGMGDIDRTLAAGAFLNLRHEELRFKSSIRQDVLDEGHGLLVNASIESRIPWDTPWFTLQLGTNWASGVHVDTFFGIDALQSLNSGLRAYDPGAGFRDVYVTISSGYRFTDRWAINGQAQYLRLLGDAADSPLVEDQGDADQFVVGMGVTYTF